MAVPVRTDSRRAVKFADGAAGILGLGLATPKVGLAQEAIADWAKGYCQPSEKQTRLLQVLYRSTGIQRRYSVLAEEGTEANSSAQLPFYAPPAISSDLGPSTRDRMQRYAAEAVPLGSAAASRALKDANLAPAQIDYLITVSCTGFFAPGLDIGLIGALGLKPDVGRLHVGFMGCHGVFNALRQAKALCAENPRAHVLICAVELCSLHLQYGWDDQKLVSNSLFADGAAAVVLGAPPEAARGSSSTGTNPVPWRVAALGSRIFPDATDAMSWNIGDHGFEMTLSRRVPELIQAHLRPWLEQWLATQGLSLNEVGTWAIHPGGPRIVQIVETALGLPPETASASREVLSEFGNMSSPTILFILERLRAQNAARPCVALGFGPGLAAEAALIR